MSIGIKIEESGKNMVKVSRVTRESEIVVNLDKSERRDFKIDTKIEFFNHMLETIAWRFGVNIDIMVL